jgi:hypothetical protein
MLEDEMNTHYPEDDMYSVGREDGYLYGYLVENGPAQWIGDIGTPIKMTMEVTKKLLGDKFEDYTLVLAK